MTKLRDRAGACLALATLLVLAAAAEARSPRVWIASGPPGGSYRGVYARALERGLDDFLVLHRTTSGSGENLDLISQGKVAVAFVQADVFAARRAADPERFAEVDVLGRLADECLYVAGRRGGRVAKVDDLEVPPKGRPYEIALGEPGGGTSGSWSYLVQLRPALAEAKVYNVGGRLALQRLADGTFDVVMWVTDPKNLDHRMLRDTRSNEAIELLEVLEEGALGGLLPDGTRVYDVRSIVIEPGDAPRRVRTVCTSALVIARRDAPENLVKRVRQIFELPPVSPGGRSTAPGP